jgi:Na+/H+ antiporter NhaD/arsenite permease-like protein
MTVTALLLAALVQKPKKKLIYYLLGTLFVNVSIGGALTPFAAPPILMVAGKWGWDFSYVFAHLGWKSAVAVILNSLLFVSLSAQPLKDNCQPLAAHAPSNEKIPFWVTALHFLILIGLVLTAHHASTVLGIFLLFLGVTTVTRKFQNTLRYRESLLVAFFLAGIVMFGAFQKWWLEPLLSKMNEVALYFVATGLTAITDNAALTFLGSQVEALSDVSRYFLVAGAIAGGGLTVIANAPNAAGYSVLQRHLPDGLNARYLFLGALIPTVVAVVCLGFL